MVSGLWLAVGVPVQAQAALAPPGLVNANTLSSADTARMMTCTVLVLRRMTLPGMAFFSGGRVPRKSVPDVMACVMATCASVCAMFELAFAIITAALLSGVFASKAIGSVLTQFTGTGALMRYRLVMTALRLRVTSPCVSLRVSEADEIAGLDRTQHAERLATGSINF